MPLGATSHEFDVISKIKDYLSMASAAPVSIAEGIKRLDSTLQTFMMPVSGFTVENYLSHKIDVSALDEEDASPAGF